MFQNKNRLKQYCNSSVTAIEQYRHFFFPVQSLGQVKIRVKNWCYFDTGMNFVLQLLFYLNSTDNFCDFNPGSL